MTPEETERVIELETQLRLMARRVRQLWRHRAGLIAILRSVRYAEGIAPEHRKNIDKVLDSPAGLPQLGLKEKRRTPRGR